MNVMFVPAITVWLCGSAEKVGGTFTVNTVIPLVTIPLELLTTTE
jgi:hypothetical protein